MLRLNIWSIVPIFKSLNLLLINKLTALLLVYILLELSTSAQQKPLGFNLKIDHINIAVVVTD